jgi:hypothetical protein
VPTLEMLSQLLRDRDAAGLSVWLVAVVVWCVTLRAIGYAVFGSGLARRVARAMEYPVPAALVEELDRVTWELKHKAHYDERLAAGQLAEKKPLSMADRLERVNRRRELVAALDRDPRRFAWLRALVRDLLGCGFCQQFWVALIVLLAFGVSPINAALTAFAVAGATVTGEAMARRKPAKGGCPGSHGAK